jgi:hypothetical protein
MHQAKRAENCQTCRRKVYARTNKISGRFSNYSDEKNELPCSQDLRVVLQTLSRDISANQGQE